MTSTSEAAPRRAAVIAAILAGGFMAATFDFFAAMLIYGAPASAIARAMARGWFGAAVKTMPPIAEVVGLASHYAILLVAAAIFTLTSLRFPALRRWAWITGPVFGVCIYLVMHFVVLPLSQVHATNNPKGLKFVEDFLGHLFVIGLPIALWARALVGRK